MWWCRYCWQCHQPGHSALECSAGLPQDKWCPRCLDSDHWEDECWVSPATPCTGPALPGWGATVLCAVCSGPGHLPAVHDTTDYRQRKLVIDTFGWLSFKDWFQVRIVTKSVQLL